MARMCKLQGPKLHLEVSERLQGLPPPSLNSAFVTATPNVAHSTGQEERSAWGGRKGMILGKLPKGG